MQQFCDDKKPLLSKPIYASSNNVTVAFYSDATENAKGFEAIYEAIPVNGKKRPSVASRSFNFRLFQWLKKSMRNFATAKFLWVALQHSTTTTYNNYIYYCVWAVYKLK